MNEDEIVQPVTIDEPVEETVETPETAPTGDTLETPEIDVEQLQATNKKLFERAKKAEAELKALKPKVATAPVSPASPQLDPVEAALLVNGMSEELLGELKTVAKVRGVSLLKAQNDPIFVAVKEKFEKDKRQRDASLPASRGAGGTKVKKSLTTPGLSREEHMKMIAEL